MVLLPKADAILSDKVNLLNGHGDHLFWHEYALVLIRVFFFLLAGGESQPCCVSAAAAGPLLTAGQVFGAFAHLQRTGEPAAHRVAAGEELLRECNQL